MARFVIDTGEISMSKEDTMALQADIQGMVLGHVAKLGYDKPWVTKFPREWYGIILHPELGGLQELEKELGNRLGGLR